MELNHIMDTVMARGARPLPPSHVVSTPSQTEDLLIVHKLYYNHNCTYRPHQLGWVSEQILYMGS